MPVILDPAVEAKQKNRRRSPRRKPRTSVKVQCRKGTHGLGPNVAVSLLDISDSGIRVVLKQELTNRDEVEIMIVAHGVLGTIKRHGYVRWQLKLENGLFCAGIEFQKSIKYRDWQVISSPN